MAGRKDFRVPSARFCRLETWPTVKMCPLVMRRSDQWVLRSKWGIYTAPPRLRKHQGRRDGKTMRARKEGTCGVPSSRQDVDTIWKHSLSTYPRSAQDQDHQHPVLYKGRTPEVPHLYFKVSNFAIKCYIGTSIPKTMKGISHSHHHS